MNGYTFHISLYGIAYIAAIAVGLNFALLLWFTKTSNRGANRFLSLALATMIVWMIRLLAIDIGLQKYILHWDWIPLQFLLATGPLLYFYVLKTTRPLYKLQRSDLLHFMPLFIELSILSLEIKESWLTGAATYATHVFQQFNPVLQVFIFISNILYLRSCNQIIKNFYRGLQPVLMDRPRVEFRWLRRLLAATAVLWLLWLFLAATNFFGYSNQLSVSGYYPFYLFFVVIIIWTATAAFLQPQAAIIGADTPVSPKASVPIELRSKGEWLKQVLQRERYYEDPELSLGTLAGKLNMSPHELSKLINTVFRISFTDFINQYRVQDAAHKICDASHEQMTLLGIGFDAGFNSKTSFNRIFKHVTGKSPTEYKKYIQNKRPPYNMGRLAGQELLILNREPLLRWTPGKLNSNSMFRNYFKIGWRNIARHKVYTTINILGLALGVCACIVIFLITGYDLGFDRFHPDKERIYRVVGELQRSSGEKEFLNSPVPDVAGFQKQVPGFETTAAFYLYSEEVTISNGNNQTKKFGGRLKREGSWQAAEIITGPQYFDIFKYQWLAGNAKAALSSPFTVVLTKKRAEEYFGNIPLDKVIGKKVIYADSLVTYVSGVVRDWKENTDFGFTDFISTGTATNSFLRKFVPSNDWTTLSPHQSMAFVKLLPGTTAAQINASFTAFIKQNVKLQDPGSILRMFLQPITDIHFTKEFHRGDDGDNFNKVYPPTLYALMGVALFILIIAIANFINLSTAQSIQRAKEVGIRKVMGSSKSKITWQFLTETFTLTFCAVVLSALLVNPVLSLFSSYVPNSIHFSILQPGTLLFLLMITILTTLLAGFYPAKVLAAYLPVLSLKGGNGNYRKDRVNFRKALIVFQFTISLVFIIGAIVINKQIKFMTVADKGFSTEGIITLSNWDDHAGKMEVFAEQVKQIPGVIAVVREANAPMGFAQSIDNYKFKGKEEVVLQVSAHIGNRDFIPFYKMKLIAGRNMLPADSLNELVINETLARRLGFSDPGDAIGTLLYQQNAIERPYPIVGVVADFHTGSFHEAIQPAVIENVPDRKYSLAIKLAANNSKTGGVKQTLSAIEAAWKKTFPEKNFNYSFLDDSISWLFGQEQNTRWLMNIAMTVTIFISCMGLFGLGMFTTQQRTKEIGIRKVLGASVSGIAGMLSKDFIKLVLIAVLIASPLAYYFMSRWLQDFAYRTTISWWIFIVAGSAGIITALATVSYQAIKAAVANPVDSLRNE